MYQTSDSYSNNVNSRRLQSTILRRELSEWAERYTVTGALYKKTDPKIPTALKTQSSSKDKNKDKDNLK